MKPRGTGHHDVIEREQRQNQGSEKGKVGTRLSLKSSLFVAISRRKLKGKKNNGDENGGDGKGGGQRV